MDGVSHGGRTLVAWRFNARSPARSCSSLAFSGPLGNGAWYTFVFDMASYNAQTYNITFGRGGFQGGEGSDSGERYYLEGLPELLDAANEFYFDAGTGKLYYYSNTSTGTPPSANDLFYAPRLDEVSNVAEAC